MDIGSGKGYPSASLSNFTPHPFIIDGVECNSMEGFLQSLKYKNPEIQKEVCKLVGKKAKFKGKRKKWWKHQVLYWNGKEYDRHRFDYQVLLTRAFMALANNEKFKRALLATENASLTHNIGKKNPHRTVLTRSEFIRRLEYIREKLQKDNKK